jgi:flagellar biosynthesis chaperone FliJ
MPTSYRAQVAVAFEVLAEGLAPFVDERMHRAHPDEDWILMAATKLGKRRDVLVSLSDPHFQLEVLNRWWGPAFADDLPADARTVVGELRTARNHWAHPDPDHPFDLDYAMRVHNQAEDLLRAIDSPLADRLGRLAEDLRWAGIRDVARERGMSETEALLQQMTDLHKEYDDLRTQLDDARAQAQSASGRSRAVSRQLAELQSQYAAVAGLRDQYEEVQRQLEEERRSRTGAEQDTSVRDQLDGTERALAALRDESANLRHQLESARTRFETARPTDTEMGRRWLWLMAGLLAILGILFAVMATTLH